MNPMDTNRSQWRRCMKGHGATLAASWQRPLHSPKGAIGNKNIEKHKFVWKKCGDLGIPRSHFPEICSHFPEICSHYPETCSHFPKTWELFMGLEPFGAAYPQPPWTLFPCVDTCIHHHKISCYFASRPYCYGHHGYF